MSEEKPPFHPIANVFPLMSEADTKALADDIAENGLMEPITRLDGQILDGRNRLIACLSVCVKPRYQEFEGDDPVKWVISQNLHRRHLTPGQRAKVGSKIAKLKHGGDRKSDQSKNSDLDLTMGEAAQSLGISRDSIATAKKIERDGVSELNHAVETGEVTLHKAEQLLKEPPEVQREAVENRTFVAPPPKEPEIPMYEQLGQTKEQFQAAIRTLGCLNRFESELDSLDWDTAIGGYLDHELKEATELADAIYNQIDTVRDKLEARSCVAGGGDEPEEPEKPEEYPDSMVYANTAIGAWKDATIKVGQGIDMTRRIKRGQKAGKKALLAVLEKVRNHQKIVQEEIARLEEILG